MRKKVLISFGLIFAIVLSACGAKAAVEPSEQDSAQVEQTSETEVAQEAEPVQEAESTPEPFVSEWKGENGSQVYMTTDISPEGLLNVYHALGVTAEGNNVAVKLSTGEPGSNYLDPALIKDLVQEVKGTIVESNTAYSGTRRRDTEMHMQVAKDHGFTEIADVDIMDAEGSASIPVNGGTHLTENLVGTHFSNYDYFVVLSHFKGHEMAGFGGAIKNISIGIASTEGKCRIHTAGKSSNSISGDTASFQESMGEAGKSVVDSLDGKILYINVMNKISSDCDCNPHPAEPRIADIGILASTDPVALDQACVDLIYGCPEEGVSSLITRIEMLNGTHTLEYAYEIGLGDRHYQLVSIDD